jgi:rhodanese-related sulfurtransferase
VLEGIGCTEVHVLEGGHAAWQAAGFELFSASTCRRRPSANGWSTTTATPSVDPAELKAMQDRGEDLLIVDSRPLAEFRAMSIPGGINVPGGELAYRVPGMVARPSTTVVVNCAGRTRSILGAESLRQAGLPNTVVALRNGTMGWELAGLRCDRGREDRYAAGTPADAAESLARARRFAAAHGVKPLDPAGLDALLREEGANDLPPRCARPGGVRGGPPACAVSAPGGQLVQATDGWVAVRGARVVLVDDTGVRARMTAGWLRQLGGWEVFVLDGQPRPSPRPPRQM